MHMSEDLHIRPWLWHLLIFIHSFVCFFVYLIMIFFCCFFYLFICFHLFTLYCVCLFVYLFINVVTSGSGSMTHFFL